MLYFFQKPFNATRTAVVSVYSLSILKIKPLSRYPRLPIHTTTNRLLEANENKNNIYLCIFNLFPLMKALEVSGVLYKANHFFSFHLS